MFCANRNQLFLHSSPCWFWINVENALIDKCKEIMLSLWWQIFVLFRCYCEPPAVVQCASDSVGFWNSPWLFFLSPRHARTAPCLCWGPSDLQIKRWLCYKMPEKPAVEMKVQSVVAIERRGLVWLHWCELTSQCGSVQAVASFESSLCQSFVWTGLKSE